MSLLRAHAYALRTLSIHHLPPLTNSLHHLRPLTRTMTTSTSNSSTTSTSTSPSTTPIEDSIRQKLTTLLTPHHLLITNDSAAHAHHTAMRPNASLPTPNLETHFRVLVVSDAFEGKGQPARHRIVYRALEEEMAGGVHALQIETRTGGEKVMG